MLRTFMLCLALQTLSGVFCIGQEPLLVAPCDQNEQDDWSLIQQEMDGARAIDIDNSAIGPYVAKRFLLFDNWHPLLESKQISCGKLRHFKVYNFLFGEHDWNLYLQPTGTFEKAFQDAVVYASDKGQVWNCDTPHNPRSSGKEFVPNCFEAEVTPFEHFRANNPWFHGDDTSELSIDQKVCAMGPWVAEYVHGARPELHPVETIWWKQAGGPFWTFIEAQDASHRFEDRSDFVNTPKDWVPWDASPRQHDLRVAAELDFAAGMPALYTVTQVPNCHGNLPPAEQPMEATERVYTYDSKPILRVVEKRDSPGFTVKPSFCLRSIPTPSLIGYIEIRAGIGNGDKEGYQAITVQNGDAT